jgi:glycosyltransferase involved in cell wall biosynthesis
MDKKKIYWLSDSPTTCTGYATISANVMNGLTEAGYDCHYQAHNIIGQNIMPGLTFEDGRKLNFTIHGTGRMPYSQDLLIPKIRQMKPDVFITLLDTFMLYPWYPQMDFAPAKTIFYFPSDGGGFPLGCEQILRKCNVPVAMSRFGQKQLWEDHKIKCEYIPHAVDTENYFPMTPEQRLELRRKWGLEGKFVVGSVFRNQGRKMPDRQLRAFAEFAKGKDDAIFLLHTDPTDVASVFNIIEFIKKLGIENKVRFTGMTFHKGFTYKEMNNVYNLMDVHFLSTSGEGFGVPIIEAAACGIPGIVTDYTTTQELLIEGGVCGLAVPISSELMGNWNVDRGIMDIDKGAEALQMMYDNPLMRKEMGDIGREKVLREYSWDVVNKQWIDLIERITNE